jgi:hypothetical protein
MQTSYMAESSKRIAIICGNCGSDEVSRDAWANWDAREQEWVLGAVFDYGHCHRCDGESRLVEVELARP